MPQPHTTEDEVRFVKSLGNHSPISDQTPAWNLKLLRGYCQAIQRRAKWDHIDRDTVSRVANIRRLELEYQVAAEEQRRR